MSFLKSRWSLLSMLMLSALPISAMASDSYSDFKWGRIVCEAVTKADANQFFKNDEFADLYGAPKGTISCTLPLQIWQIAGDDVADPTQKTYTMGVSMVNPPMAVKPCQVTYFDNSPTRTFAAEGDGHGYVNLVKGVNSFDVSFGDTSGNRKSSVDNFVVISVGTSPEITWANEMQGYGVPTEPIVSRCHIEMPVNP